VKSASDPDITTIVDPMGGKCNVTIGDELANYSPEGAARKLTSV
jgi:hypothetical protein